MVVKTCSSQGDEKFYLMDSAKIEELLEKYENTQGISLDTIKKYNQRHHEEGLGKKELYELAFESSTRSAYHVKENSDKFCKEVIGNLESVQGDFSKIALITSLKGFKAATASVILAVVDPENHAIVDTRVWASLERLDKVKGRKESFDAFDYVEMMDEIRGIASETGFTPLEVGCALFAYDVEMREGKLH